MAIVNHISRNTYTIELMIDLSRLHDMLHDYFSVEFPSEFLMEILATNSDCLREVLDGAETDTFAREGFIGAICNKLDLPAWPCLGDGQFAMEIFIPKFNAAIEKVGGKFIAEEV